jgi:hypothetical protein
LVNYKSYGTKYDGIRDMGTVLVTNNTAEEMVDQIAAIAEKKYSENPVTEFLKSIGGRSKEVEKYYSILSTADQRTQEAYNQLLAELTKDQVITGNSVYGNPLYY